MKRFFIIGIILLIIIFGVVFLAKNLSKPKVVHFHAGFQVYKNGVLQDYSGFQYMSLLPCGKVYTDPADEQLEKAHLHNNIGDVVHVHREGATWGDLLKNINVSFAIPPTGYINGEKIATILSQPIRPYDSLILFEGKHKAVSEYLPHAVSIKHIKLIEKISENCGI